MLSTASMIKFGNLKSNKYNIDTDMKIRYLLVALLALTFWGCDDNTGSLGIDMMRPEDHINGMVENYNVTSQSIAADKIYAKTSTAYLGKYTDPLFGLFEADFMAQFACTPDFKFPDKEVMPGFGTGPGEQEVSAEIRFYYTSFFGDSLNASKMKIFKLDKKTLIEGDPNNYYTSIDPKEYYDENSEPLAEKSYSAVNLSYTQSYRDSIKAGYYPGVTATLDKSVANDIISTYYSNPDLFKNPETFQKVFPGIYTQCIDGDGTVLYIDRIWLRLTFKYNIERKSTGKVDSLVTGAAVFAATKEVIQANRFQNKDGLQDIINEKNHTYLKTPAGIFTKAILPINEVINGSDPTKPEAHKNDSINSVSLSFTCYNQENEIFKIPNNILMIREKDMDTFFEKNQVPDNKTSYVSTYSSNKYSFSNIANLVTTCINEKKKAQGSMSDEEWEKANPDWNSVVLIPVKLSLDNNSNIIKVEHDLQMNSVKLKGGDPNKGGTTTDMKVIYSRFSK